MSTPCSSLHPLSTPARQREWLLLPATRPHDALMAWPAMKAAGLPVDALESYRRQAREVFNLELPPVQA